ncbi:MAG: hypothetical protein L0Z50_42205 [Verrucomicrobiales bacterium]|nr:hypothetical protein [Verrucomicrobiales bacterium]
MKTTTFPHCLFLFALLGFGGLTGCSGADRFDGMYLMTRMWGSSLETSAYYFSRDGEVFEKPTGGSDFKAMKGKCATAIRKIHSCWRQDAGGMGRRPNADREHNRAKGSRMLLF